MTLWLKDVLLYKRKPIIFPYGIVHYLSYLLPPDIYNQKSSYNIIFEGDGGGDSGSWEVELIIINASSNWTSDLTFTCSFSNSEKKFFSERVTWIPLRRRLQR